MIERLTIRELALVEELSLELGPGLNVFTGETHYRVRLIIRDEDTVEVPAGRFEALRVEPEVIKIEDGERPDKNMRRATIWVTRTPVRTLLRIRSEVFVGAITLDLVGVDRRS